MRGIIAEIADLSMYIFFDGSPSPIGYVGAEQCQYCTEMESNMEVEPV